jgi:hypothetical protein
LKVHDTGEEFCIYYPYNDQILHRRAILKHWPLDSQYCSMG